MSLHACKLFKCNVLFFNYCIQIISWVTIAPSSAMGSYISSLWVSTLTKCGSYAYRRSNILISLFYYKFSNMHDVHFQIECEHYWILQGLIHLLQGKLAANKYLTTFGWLLQLFCKYHRPQTHYCSPWSIVLRDNLSASKVSMAEMERSEHI